MRVLGVLPAALAALAALAPPVATVGAVEPAAPSVCPRIVSRDDWGARLPKKVHEMHTPVSTVLIHHTYSPAACSNSKDCAAAMQSMQDYHMDDRGWDDIGYSFAVGGDGLVYKGRGWNRVGAHAPPYNFDSIGITLIGDWRAEAPPEQMLEAAKWLIQCGVETGRIAADYQVIGHRQARSTECPGDALFAVVQGWPHWAAEPAPPRHRAPQSRTAPTAAAAAAPTAPPATPSPAALAGTYDPAPPVVERDAVEVRQLDKRSLWDRLVRIWQQEALRQARQAGQAGQAAGLDDQDASLGAS